MVCAPVRTGAQTMLYLPLIVVQVQLGLWRSGVERACVAELRRQEPGEHDFQDSFSCGSGLVKVVSCLGLGVGFAFYF